MFSFPVGRPNRGRRHPSTLIFSGLEEPGTRSAKHGKKYGRLNRASSAPLRLCHQQNHQPFRGVFSIRPQQLSALFIQLSWRGQPQTRSSFPAPKRRSLRPPQSFFSPRHFVHHFSGASNQILFREGKFVAQIEIILRTSRIHIRQWRTGPRPARTFSAKGPGLSNR